MKKRIAVGFAAAALSVMMSMTAFADWRTTDDGRKWYESTDGRYYADGWKADFVDELRYNALYYFDEQGYLLTNTTTPDGHYVNADGRMIMENTIVNYESSYAMNASFEWTYARLVNAPVNRDAAPGWKQTDDGRWWFALDNAATESDFKTRWVWIYDPAVQGMKAYGFDKDGYLITNQTAYGKQANEKGEWVLNGQVQIRYPATPKKYMSELEMEYQLKNGTAATQQTSTERPSSAAGWKQNGAGGWNYMYNNMKLSGGWWWIYDSSIGAQKGYYFDSQGNLLTDTTTPDGYYVNKKGEWERDGVVMTFKRDGATRPQKEDSSHAQMEELLDINHDLDSELEKLKEKKREGEELLEKLERLRYSI